MAIRRPRLRTWLGTRLGTRRGTVLVVALALALVAGALVLGAVVWQRLTRTDLEEALHAVPASSLRVGFTDWALVRRTLEVDLGSRPGPEQVEDFITKAYDTDFVAASSIDESAAALQELYGFSPATAQWEVFAQGRSGAAMVLRTPDSDFGDLAGNLRSLGYERPDDDGVWRGGVDLVAGIDPTISPELQHVVLLEDEGLVVSSDNADYAAATAKVALGEADSVATKGSVGEVAEAFERPANAMLWTGDFACSDLAMTRADEDAQTQAKQLVDDAGGVDPIAGMAMSMSADRALQVVQAFESSEQAADNLRPRATLAVGEAVGRGGTFADDFELTSSRAVDSTVRLVLEPRQTVGYVLSAVYDGPLIFATC